MFGERHASGALMKVFVDFEKKYMQVGHWTLSSHHSTY
jgi:hypothetical protein